MRRSAVFRGWGVLWAVLQFALPSVATFADARLERDSALAPGTHVESTTGATCRPSHPDECALCQFLSHDATPSHTSAPTAIAELRRASAESPLLGVATRARARVCLPRAPPNALA